MYHPAVRQVIETRALGMRLSTARVPGAQTEVGELGPRAHPGGLRAAVAMYGNIFRRFFGLEARRAARGTGCSAPSRS